MKYQLNTLIKNLDGSDSAEKVKDGFIVALLSNVDKNGEPVRNKAARYSIFIKVANKDEVELTAEEVSLLKEAVWVFPTLTAGQLVDFLEKN